MFKKIKWIFILGLSLFLFSGCHLFVLAFGDRADQYLYSARKTIKKHHEKWFGEDSSSSRTVAGIVTKPTEEMLADNMDYLAQNDWIVSFEYYTGEVTDELRQKYNLFDTYNHPFVAIKTNNGVTYCIAAFPDWDNGDSYENFCRVVNKGFEYVEGAYPSFGIEIFCDPEIGYFYFYRELWIVNQFPYPVSYRFNTKEIELHQDADKPNYYYWGVDLTGIESETYRSLEPVTVQEWLDECSDGSIDMDLLDLRLRKAHDMGWWDYNGTQNAEEFYKELYTYNLSNMEEGYNLDGERF